MLFDTTPHADLWNVAVSEDHVLPLLSLFNISDGCCNERLIAWMLLLSDATRFLQLVN